MHAKYLALHLLRSKQTHHDKDFTWTIISSSMRSVQLILSMTWSEPLYSMTAFPTLISLLNMLTTNSPLSRNSPRLFDMAAGGQKTTLLLLSHLLCSIPLKQRARMSSIQCKSQLTTKQLQKKFKIMKFCVKMIGLTS